MASQDWFDKDFYAVLGVSKDATDADIRKSYRKLARQYHPDTHPGDAAAEARFKEISEAYSVLSDPEQRREYDQIRTLGFNPMAGGAAGGQNFEDIFGSMFGGGGGTRFTTGGGQSFEDIFSMFGGAARRGPTRGRDYTATTTLDFTTAVTGDTVRLQGPQGKPINVKIPAGVADGQKIKLRGKGEPSPNGGEPGDLVLTVTVKPHPVFTRDGSNLRVTVPVTFPEAALGATIQVPTLSGDPVKLKVPAGTPSGRVLRVKRKGVATSKGTGDLLVELQVVVPNHLSGEALKRLKEFAEALPDEDPREDLIAKAKGAR